MTERDHAMKLDSVYHYFSSSSRDHKNRMTKAIKDYFQAVKKNGLDNQSDYLNCGNFKKTYGISLVANQQLGIIRLRLLGCNIYND